MVAYAKGTCKGERMADDEYRKIKIGSNSCSVTISLARENWLLAAVAIIVRHFHFVLIIESRPSLSLLLTPFAAVKAFQYISVFHLYITKIRRAVFTFLSKDEGAFTKSKMITRES